MEQSIAEQTLRRVRDRTWATMGVKGACKLALTSESTVSPSKSNPTTRHMGAGLYTVSSACNYWPNLLLKFCSILLSNGLENLSDEIQTSAKSKETYVDDI